MRKIPAITALFAAISVLLCGCTGKIASPDSPPSPPPSLSAELEVAYGEHKVTALFSQNADGSSVLDTLSPPSLEPLKITYSGDDVTVTYDDLIFETDLARFPETAFGSVLVDILKVMSSDAPSITSEYSNGVWTHSGECGAGKFILRQSHETGLWQSAEVDSIGLKITFSDIKTT